ncbi:hypothetical protein [Sphingopyxis macrogoltabida]|uniref:HIG1 domain-containing protein n=1 Tax=Sphingopyxis macrogoltabida TaxID=33050 RepID=A0A0N9UBX0_SPHMC|nr:hypothetical protein [Sphingopyxis macrogoltabida]ALH82930.1 hypothetical protein AN936_22005 [Sphingopyxis macrogoltabida]
MSDTVWGIIFTAYILAALPIMGMGNGAAQRPQGLPGSSNVASYDAREKRFQKIMVLWIAGLVALLAAWAYL